MICDIESVSVRCIVSLPIPFAIEIIYNRIWNIHIQFACWFEAFGIVKQLHRTKRNSKEQHFFGTETQGKK